MSSAKSHKPKAGENAERKPRSSPQSRARGPSSNAPADDPATLDNPFNRLTAGAKPDPTTETPAEAPPEKQSWWRPADSKMRPTAVQIVAWRTAGKTDADIAKKLKTTEANVRQTLYIARKNGWLGEDDLPVETDIEDEIATNLKSKVARNISASLDGRMTNWQTHEMTMKAAAGFGIFKSEHKVDVTQNATSLVQIQVVRVDPEGVAAKVREIPPEQMGGTPAYIEGEVCSGTQTDTATGPSAAIALTEMPKFSGIPTRGPAAGE